MGRNNPQIAISRTIGSKLIVYLDNNYAAITGTFCECINLGRGVTTVDITELT